MARLRAIGGHESNSVLKVTGRCLIKIRLYAGTPENPTLLVSVLSPTSTSNVGEGGGGLEAVTMRWAQAISRKGWIRRRNTSASRILRDCTPDTETR